jgi:hypothetical protein
MGGVAQQVYGWIASVVFLLLGWGLWSAVTNLDSASYLAANKERVTATISDRQGDSHVCTVTLDQGGRTVQLATPALAGACDDQSPLHDGLEVQIEYWNGRPTAIYDGQLSWPTVDNPGNKAALADTAIFFGVLIAVPTGIIFGVHYALTRNRSPRGPDGAGTAPPADSAPAGGSVQKGWTVYPPE